MEIRNATETDAAAISRMYRLLYPPHESDRENKSPLNPITHAQIRTFLFVAEEQTLPIGFIWGNYIEYGQFNYGMIEELFVEENYRNKGIGAALISKLLDEMKKLNTTVVFVSTQKENAQGIHTYEKLGFEICKGPFYFKIP